MIIYKYLFYSVFRFLKITNRSYPKDTDDTMAFTAALLISLFQLLNLMSFMSSVRGPMIIAPTIMLAIFNIIVFYIGDRYKKFSNTSLRVKDPYFLM